MVALWSIPGSSLFDWRHVATKADGLAWFERKLGSEPTQADLHAYRQSEVVSDRVAASLRWQSGERILPRDKAEWSERGATQDATTAADTERFGG